MDFLKKHLAFLVLLTAGLFLAYALNWIQDDSYISLVYARNLAQGHGLTWGGEAIQGFSNPLWVFLCALGFLLPVEIHLFLLLLQLVVFALLLTAIYALGLMLFEKRFLALLPVALHLVNFSALKYSSGGLETSLQTLFFVGLVFLLEKFRRTGRQEYAAAFSVLCFLAAITHPTSGLFVIVAAAMLLAAASRKKRLRQTVKSMIPGMALSAAWLVFAASYFGSVLPNTFVAKMGAGTHYEVGLRQIGLFLGHYGYFWILLLGLAGLWAQRPPSWFNLLLGLVLTWFGVIVAIGGDFMEFRILIPVLPLLHILITRLLGQIPPIRFVPFPAVSLIVLAVMGCFSWHHAHNFRNIFADQTIDGFSTLATFYYAYPDEDFSAVGSALKDYFAPRKPLVATTGAGAIPFFSGFPTIDSWGLNDRWVARHGVEVPPDFKRPGHRRRAPLSYLIQRHTDLVVEHPLIVGNERWLTYREDIINWLGLTPGFLEWQKTHDVVLVRIPVGPDRQVVVWLLNEELLQRETMTWILFRDLWSSRAEQGAS